MKQLPLGARISAALPVVVLKQYRVCYDTAIGDILSVDRFHGDVDDYDAEGYAVDGRIVVLVEAKDFVSAATEGLASVQEYLKR